ncbi:MAG: hypothetical protein AVDCRST_MAG29-970, partial [uncultured Nocardioidaceae bacterium]
DGTDAARAPARLGVRRAGPTAVVGRRLGSGRGLRGDAAAATV